MKETRKRAKDALTRATLDEYNYLIENARLSTRQKFILNEKLIKKRFSYQIAMTLEVSPETIRDDLRDAYERVEKLL